MLWGHHGFLSSHGMALSKSVSVEHGFMLFTDRHETRGRLVYEAYNRFPPTTYLLLGAEFLFASDDPLVEIAMGRYTMRAFMAGALVCAFLVARRLAGSSVVGAGVALLAFSSFYVAYYADMIFNDIPSLFGFLLTLHGIVVREQDGSRRQLGWKVLVGICLGWQTLAMVAAYAFCRGMAELRSGNADLAPVRAFSKSDGFRALLASAALSALLVGCNLANESRVTNEPLREVPSYRSLVKRVGLDPEFNRKYEDSLRWTTFAKAQLARVAIASVPLPEAMAIPQDGALVAVSACALLMGALFLAATGLEPVLHLTMLLAGPLWIVSMRHFTTFHDFQALFVIGVPMVLLLGVARVVVRGRVASAALLALGLLAFVHAHLQLEERKSETHALGTAVATDLRRIRALVPRDARLWVDGKAYDVGFAEHAIDFYLAQAIRSERASAQFVLTKNRKFEGRNLTPEARQVFLFRTAPTSPRVPVATEVRVVGD